MRRRVTTRHRDPETPSVAIIGWTYVLDDYLDGLGMSFEELINDSKGGWMFGYCDALQRVGVRPDLIFFSARMSEPVRRIHRATNASISVLPAPLQYRVVRRCLPNPYGLSFDETGGHQRGWRRARDSSLWHLAPYLATPLWRLGRELARKYDAILCQDYEHGRFDECVVLGRMLKIPVFATFQGGDTALSPLERILRPRAMRACTGLVVASARERTRLTTRYQIPPSKVVAICNPLDSTEWEPIDRREARAALGIPADTRVVVWHGRVHMDRKGLDVLLDAWETICSERPGRDVRLILIGSGGDAEELRQRIASMTPSKVQWVDEYVTDRAKLVRYLSASDAYVLPSRREGFPVAPVEAMACGLPVVAADVAGISDILPDGEGSGGLVVPVADPAALAEAVGRLIDDPAFARALGKRARESVGRRFSPDEVGRQLRAFLFPSSPADTLRS